MTFTIIVTGSRDYHVGYRITDALAQIARSYEYDIFVKVGDCSTGVDKYVISWCETALENKFKIFKANWTKYGKKAGPIRNHEMVDSGADLCIAWPLEESKGTKDCTLYAASKDIPVWFPDLPSWAQWASPVNQWRH